MLERKTLVAVILVLMPVGGLSAHDVDVAPAVVIDTDMGIDDAMTLAAALQAPQLRIAACVSSEGVQDRRDAADALGRMLYLFNRGDVKLHEGAAPTAAASPPPFRPFASEAVERALSNPRGITPESFTPAAYRHDGPRKVLVFALGPLTNIAAAINDPAVVEGLDRVLVQGSPDPAGNWNLRRDPAAFEAVRRSGVPIEFITADAKGIKPADWAESGRVFGRHTSIGEAFALRLLTDRVRAHYTKGLFASFTDELVLLYAVDHDLFERISSENARFECYRPANGDAVTQVFTRLLDEGRQRKNRVVFKPGPLPTDILMPDVRLHAESIIARHGENEFFAMLLMNELHEHLGSYSILGVKMGLRAAELLNAPQHGMQVVSHSAARPPVSCLNDGILVSTGSTPGRALFKHEPGPAGSTRVCFAYNGRTIALSVKDEYRSKIQGTIDKLLEQYTLEDERYWLGVRRMSIDIWENWHRRDLFDVEAE